MKHNLYLSAIALSISTLLTGCGGGGGGDTAAAVTPAPVVPTTPVVEPSTIVTAVATSTYATTSEEYAAFNLLNAERQRCGFGTLAQNAKLDQAALAHANWQLLNKNFAHIETAGTAGFTGVSPTNRATAAGYSAVGLVGEMIAFGTTASKAGRGAAGVRDLFSAPYHALTAIGPYLEVGISVRSPLDLGLNLLIHVTQVNTANATTAPVIASDAVATYPCEGTTDVNYRLTGEIPNPVPGRNLLGTPLGHPIMVILRPGRTLTITSATLMKVSNSTFITLRTPVTSVNDPHNIFFVNEGYVIPNAALEPSTNYEASINGTNNGVSFTRTFRFMTGTGG